MSSSTDGELKFHRGFRFFVICLSFFPLFFFILSCCCWGFVVVVVVVVVVFVCGEGGWGGLRKN